jgi:glycyl-tRNA synthetase beta chain
MRWGTGESAFVRPVRGLLALLGAEIVPMEIFGVAARSVTIGHRLLSDGEFPVQGPEDYFAKLRAAYVEPDGETRRTRILEQARHQAEEVGGTIEAEADLASLLANLVEWPGVVRGSFDPEFLALPEEITTTAMRAHQKYFPVRGKIGLIPHFISVMDNKEDRLGLIAKGNEWVLNARLADARFFYDEDTKKKLEAHLPELERLTFQERLGDYRQKTRRVEELAETIAHVVGRPDLIEPVGMAARLSKLDLCTRMVREFTELQGIVGGIYARREGFPDVVWKAVYDQYRPASATDEPPREASGAILTLADRFDTLAGLFSIGVIPTGSKDPYGLRRAAQGIVSVVISRRWRLDWRPVVRRALALYPPEVATVSVDQTLSELEKFFAERLRNLFERRGHTYDEISAVTNVGVWDFADAAERALALSEARREIDFRSLILAFKRIRNIVGAEEPGAPQFELMGEDAEKQLASDFLQARQMIEGLAAARRYREAMETIASIAPSLDHFFVEVLVNTPEDEQRRNRLALLHSIQKEFSRLADFSEIVVEK